MKICSKCRVEKELSEFYKSGYGNGVRSYCKECCKKRTQEYYSDPLRKKKRYQSARRWAKNNKTRYNELSKNSRQRQRRRVLEMVGKGKLECIRCGCDVFDLLEVNHINGGGRQEVQRRNTIFYGKILRGERPIEDLNILCRLCNVLHYLEQKHGMLPYVLEWNKNE